MLIAIDGNEANIKRRVGSNIYCYELLCGLHRFKPNALIYLKSKPLPDLPKENRWWKYQVLRPKFLWTQWRLPLDLYFHRPRPDVFFTPGHYSPRWSSCPTVTTVMDLSYLYFPQMFKKKDLWQLRNWTAHSIKKAKKVLTISQFSKNAIIEHYGLKPEKVMVAYPGVKLKTQMSKRKTTTQISKLKKKYGIEGDYILYVGTLQPRKNLVRLIEAFAIVTRLHPVKLVIVGKKGWLYEEIFSKVKELGLEKKVIFTDYVPDEDLAAFYRGAKCFVLVSLYEGFGLPVLEAMAYGCPVVASNTSSLPEIVGDAGVLVDPENIEDIARGIKEAIKNRKILAEKGFKQVKKFSWGKCAQKTLEVLENVAKNH